MLTLAAKLSDEWENGPAIQTASQLEARIEAHDVDCAIGLRPVVIGGLLAVVLWGTGISLACWWCVMRWVCDKETTAHVTRGQKVLCFIAQLGMLGSGFQGSLWCAATKVRVLGVNLYFVAVANLLTVAGALCALFCFDWSDPVPTPKPFFSKLLGALMIYVSFVGRADDMDERLYCFYLGCMFIFVAGRRRDSAGGEAEAEMAVVARAEDVIPLV